MLLSGLSVWARAYPGSGVNPPAICVLLSVPVPVIWLAFRTQPKGAGVASGSPRGVETSPLHLCHRGCDPTPRLTETVIVGAVNPDHAEGPRYHVLPKDDAEAVVDIVRAAAGLPPLYGEHDNEGG